MPKIVLKKPNRFMVRGKVFEKGIATEVDDSLFKYLMSNAAENFEAAVTKEDLAEAEAKKPGVSIGSKAGAVKVNAKSVNKKTTKDVHALVGKFKVKQDAIDYAKAVHGEDLSKDLSLKRLNQKTVDLRNAELEAAGDNPEDDIDTGTGVNV